MTPCDPSAEAERSGAKRTNSLPRLRPHPKKSASARNWGPQSLGRRVREGPPPAPTPRCGGQTRGGRGGGRPRGEGAEAGAGRRRRAPAGSGSRGARRPSGDGGAVQAADQGRGEGRTPRRGARRRRTRRTVGARDGCRGEGSAEVEVGAPPAAERGGSEGRARVGACSCVRWDLTSDAAHSRGGAGGRVRARTWAKPRTRADLSPSSTHCQGWVDTCRGRTGVEA